MNRGIQQKSRLVAAQLPGLLDQRDQRRRIGGERSRLGSPLFGDLVEISLCFRQFGDKMPAQLRQIAALLVAKYPGSGGIADRQRRAYGLRDQEYLRLKVLTCMLPAL